MVGWLVRVGRTPRVNPGFLIASPNHKHPEHDHLDQHHYHLGQHQDNLDILVSIKIILISIFITLISIKIISLYLIVITISLIVLIPIIVTDNSNALTKIGKLAINWCVRWSSFHLSIFYTSYFLSI